MLFKKNKLKDTAQKVYNYHNLGVGIFPSEEEKTPHGSGERYNFDRMYMFVSNYDFTKKNILDIGCNSGWFCFQTKLLGASKTIGIDYSNTGLMGEAVNYAIQLEKRFDLGMQFLDTNVETLDFTKLLQSNEIKSFDAVFILSVLHHIKNKKELFQKIFDNTSDVVFYEDHEFWNDIFDANGAKIETQGEGHRFGWNKDITWQRRIASIEKHEKLIIDSYMNSWRRDALLLDKFASISVLGLSEKRRPVLALWKKPQI